MRTIFETCRPRQEALSGDLKEASFAARLADVAAGQADPVYGDPATFFARTHLTEGLATLLKEALDRLYGADPMAPPVLRLEAGFGGGKTHNLSALYHAASGGTPAETLRPFLPDPTLPAREKACIAVVVGDNLNPVDGLCHPDGTVTYTPWGEIAYQLGGRAAYELVRRSDEARVPGAAPWREIFGDGPVLVLLDELTPYLRTLKTWKDREALAGHLARVTRLLSSARTAV